MIDKLSDKRVTVGNGYVEINGVRPYIPTPRRGIGFFRALVISIPIGLLLWALIGFAFADEDYYYAIIKTKLIKVSDINGERIVPDVPFRLFSYYAVSNGADITYSRDLKNEGKEIMACVAVKKENEEALKHWEGYIGEEFDKVKITADYAKHFPFTIADIKRTYDKKTGEPIEYLGADKDDPARFNMWCE